MKNANGLIQDSVIVQNASLELIGTEVLDGVEYYKLDIVPEEAVFSLVVGFDLAGALLQSSLPLSINDTINLSVVLAHDRYIVNSDTLTWTAWISKNNYLLKRMAYELNTTITSEKLNESITMPNFSLSIDHASETVYSGYNQPVEIALPEEAKKAELLEETA